MFTHLKSKAFERIWTSSSDMEYLYICLDAAIARETLHLYVLFLHHYEFTCTRTQTHDRKILTNRLYVLNTFRYNIFFAISRFIWILDAASKASHHGMHERRCLIADSLMRRSTRTVLVSVVRIYFNVFALIRDVNVVKRMTIFKRQIWMFVDSHTLRRPSFASFLWSTRSFFFLYHIEGRQSSCTRSE